MIVCMKSLYQNDSVHEVPLPNNDSVQEVSKKRSKDNDYALIDGKNAIRGIINCFINWEQKVYCNKICENKHDHYQYN